MSRDYLYYTDDVLFFIIIIIGHFFAVRVVVRVFQGSHTAHICAFCEKSSPEKCIFFDKYKFNLSICFLADCLHRFFEVCPFFGVFPQ